MRADRVGQIRCCPISFGWWLKSCLVRPPSSAQYDVVAGYYFRSWLPWPSSLGCCGPGWDRSRVLAHALLNAVVLIIACPCALGLAAYVDHGGNRAQGVGGVLFKRLRRWGNNPKNDHWYSIKPAR